MQEVNNSNLTRLHIREIQNCRILYYVDPTVYLWMFIVDSSVLITDDNKYERIMRVNFTVNT
jgi:hypothetical protein